MGDLGEPRAVEPPIQLLEEGLVDERQQAAILESLVKLGEPALLPLFDALQDRNQNVRRNAVKALEKFGDARAIGLRSGTILPIAPTGTSSSGMILIRP